MKSRNVLFLFLTMNSIISAVPFQERAYIAVTRISVGGWLGAIVSVLYEKRNVMAGIKSVWARKPDDKFIQNVARGTCYGWVVGVTFAAWKIASLQTSELQAVETKKLHVKTPRKKIPGAMPLNDERLLQ